MTDYIQSLLDFVALYPALAIGLAFVVSAGEALLIIGLFVPSTVVLVGIGGLVGLGRLPLWPIFIATSLGAAVGDALSFWVGHFYKERLTAIWPFTRYEGLLTAGKQYFAAHGGKSIVIGRFIPGIKSVVPGIAGLMGMGFVRFTILNVISSIAWAAVHLFPGIFAGLALTGLGAISKRLAVAIVALVVIGAVVIWLARLAVGLGLRSLPRVQMALAGWAESRSGWIRAPLLRLLSPDHADFRLLVILIALLIGTIVGFAALLQDVAARQSVVQFDRGFSLLVQSMRTSWTDSIMVAVTMLGDWLVASAVAVAVCAILLAYRRYRLAVGLLLALAGTMLFVQSLKLIVHVARPTRIFTGADAFSFPSGHATMTATLYGVLALIALRGAGPRAGKIAFAAFTGLIALVAFSRIYLAAHWPSDVVAGLLFGAGVTAGFALVFRGYHVPRRAANSLLGATVATFLAVGTWHVALGFDESVLIYAPQPKPVVALSQPWRDGGWRDLPAYRIDIAGDAEEPLLLQWRGTPASLAAALAQQGWTAPPRWSLSSLNGFAFPNTQAAGLPALPKFHDGRRQALTLVRAGELDGKAGRFVLRVWSQDLLEPDGARATVLLGSIAFERIQHPLRQLSLPLRVGSRGCAGDPLLAGLPSPALVGDPRAAGEGACGGRTVLAAP